MFDRSESELKFSHLYQDRTAGPFGDQQEESFAGEVEVEKQYVERLKNQRGKIETLYSKYDSLFKDIKNKDVQAKENDKIIYNVEPKCKNLAKSNQEFAMYRQQNKEVKNENHTLQRAFSELEQSYAFLHGSFKPKDSFVSQKNEDLEALNDELMGKLRSLSKKYQEKEEEHSLKVKDLQIRLQQAIFQAKRQRDEHMTEQQLLKSALLQKDEDINLLHTENQCLKDRICELEAYVNQLLYESEAKLDQSHKQKKNQMKILKNQIDILRQSSSNFQKKWVKLQQQYQLKEKSLKEMTLVMEHYQKQSSEAFGQMKQQFALEKSQLKQQAIQYQNQIAKLQRKVFDCMRREEYLIGKIKKYENCLNARRNLREVEREELDKINKLLSMP